MYQNIRWIAEAHQQWDYYERFVDRLPVNPPGAHYAEGDVMIDNIGILNWLREDGQVVFEPRLRDNVQQVSRTGLGAASEDEAPELDWEYDCE